MIAAMNCKLLMFFSCEKFGLKRFLCLLACAGNMGFLVMMMTIKFQVFQWYFCILPDDSGNFDYL